MSFLVERYIIFPPGSILSPLDQILL